MPLLCIFSTYDGDIHLTFYPREGVTTRRELTTVLLHHVPDVIAQLRGKAARLIYSWHILLKGWWPPKGPGRFVRFQTETVKNPKFKDWPRNRSEIDD
jgi:hypothetical protein